MGKPGPQKVKRYSTEFKLKVVKMSLSPGVLVQDVAESLCIHPFMLSRWRKEFREGSLTGEATVVDPESVAELKRLREIELKYKRLQQEHDLLKKPYGLFPNESRHLCLHRSKPSKPPHPNDVRQVRGLALGLLRLYPCRQRLPARDTARAARRVSDWYAT